MCFIPTMDGNVTVLNAIVINSSSNNNTEGVYNALSLDYDLFQSQLNVSEGDSNYTDLNRSYPWINSNSGPSDYVVEWSDSIYPSGYSHLRIILTSLFVTIIMILIVVGNMLVCIAIATEKALKTVQNWFIASLAVSDFLVGLIVMPFSLAKEVMGYWIFGRVWCEIHSALDVFLCTASINSLCLISLDRYWSVTHAVEYLKKRTPKRSIAMIGFVWVLSAVISLPPLVGWKKPEQPSDYPECLLSDDVGYVLYSAFGSFYVPAFVMVFVYCRIFVVARSRARRHVKKKKQQAAEASVVEFTCDPVKDKSTTTTTCTSFSNPSPPDRNRDFETFSPIPERPVKNESNGTNPPKPIITTSAPEIIIETTVETADEGAEQQDTLNHHLTSSPVSDVSAPLDAEYQSMSGRRLQLQLSSESDRSTKLDMNSVSPDSPSTSPKREIAEKSRLFVSEPPKRRISMLSAPKFLKSPFGSTLSLAELGRSEEDVSDIGDDPKTGKKRRKKGKVKYQIEDLPKRHAPTEAEKQRRKLAKARERRATLILGLIMASFILAWLPFFVLYVLEALCKRCEIGPTGFAVAFWLGYCNSALNPIIYTIFNRDFRKAFRKILFK